MSVTIMKNAYTGSSMDNAGFVISVHIYKLCYIYMYTYIYIHIYISMPYIYSDNMAMDIDIDVYVNNMCGINTCMYMTTVFLTAFQTISERP